MDETKITNGSLSRRMLRERTSSMAAQVQAVVDADGIAYSQVQHMQSQHYFHNLEAIMGNIDTIEQSVTSLVAESESFSSLTSNSLLSPISSASFSPPRYPNAPIAIPIASRNQPAVDILHPSSTFKLNNSINDGHRRQYSDPFSTGTGSLSRPPPSVLKQRPSVPLQFSSISSTISAPTHFTHIQPQFPVRTAPIRRKSSILSENDASVAAIMSSSSPVNSQSSCQFSPPSVFDRLSPSTIQEQYSPPTSLLPPNIPSAPNMNRSRTLQSQSFGGRRSSATCSEGETSDGGGPSKLARFRAKRAVEKAKLAQISLQMQLLQEKNA
ncbi:hypothetical protein HK100_004386, partial [Physocladia obscura]